MNPIDTRQIINWDQVKVHLQPNLCIECQLIPLSPHQCYRCSKLLCQLCFSELKAKSRGPKIYCQKCKSLNYFNPANNSVYQNYRDMIIGCVNRRYGCKLTLDYKRYQKHTEECDFLRIPCNSPGCFVTTLKRSRADHLSVCEYVLEQCKYCNKQFNRKTMPYHMEKCQPNRQVENFEQIQSDDEIGNLKQILLNLQSQFDSVLRKLEDQEEIAQLERVVKKQEDEIKFLKRLVFEKQAK